MCQSYNTQYKTNYRCLMPTNTFGPNDSYHKINSHFFPALLKKVNDLKQEKKDKLILWGDGKSKREYIFVDDLADACIFFMNKKTKSSLINIGTGKDYSIKFYAKLFCRLIIKNKKIKIKFDKSKPNGVRRKVLDISLAKKYGWKPKTSLEDAIISSYNSYIKEIVK